MTCGSMLMHAWWLISSSVRSKSLYYIICVFAIIFCIFICTVTYCVRKGGWEYPMKRRRDDKIVYIYLVCVEEGKRKGKGKGKGSKV